MSTSGGVKIRLKVGFICALMCLTSVEVLAGESKILGPAEPWHFAFGMEYMMRGVAEIYAAAGIRWTKGAPNLWNWGSIEPNPPVNGKHTYDWEYTDTIILEWQKAGFRNFHIYTSARNPWATITPKSLFRRMKPGTNTFAVKPDRMNDYASYIRSLVERYDGDGKEDMPGLLYPIRYWEIEAEWHSFYKGTVKQYLEQLAVANKAIRQADPEAKIILVGLLMYNLFDGEPDQKEFEYRLTHPRPPIFKKTLGPRIVSEIGELLKHPELFDVVEFHSLGDWTEIIGWTKFLRAEMEKNGYQKPIWVGDANFSMYPMIFYNIPYYPYVKNQKKRSLKVLAAVDKNLPNDETVRWFRGEQARFTAKKILSSMGEGLAGINMGNTGDIPWPGMLRRFSGSGEFCGLIDIKGQGPTTRQPKNWWAPYIPGEPRPVYWTMKLLIEKLHPYTATTRLSLGKGIYAWRCSKPVPASHKPASTIFIWYEDGKGPLPGDPDPTVNVSIPTKASSARVIPIITQTGMRTATAKPIPVKKGKIVLSVGETPLLIEE